jgi:predicted MPP superfamily phosphohydrolase
MFNHLYDSVLGLLVLCTLTCTVLIYPVFGPGLTAAYVAASLLFFLTTAIDKWVDNAVARWSYTLSYLIPGFTAILTPILVGFTVAAVALAQYTGKSYISVAVRSAFYTSIILSAYAVINALFVRVREETLNIGIDEPITVAHCSDLHLGATLGLNRVKQIVEIIDENDVEFTCLTGDIFDGSGWPQSTSIKPFEQLDDIYASLGNHDYYYGDDAITMLEETTSITLLQNETVRRDNAVITGVTDTDYPQQIPGEHIRDQDPGETGRLNLLLYHRPENVDVFLASSYDAMLSGHTHGGQLFSVREIARLTYDFIEGLFQFGDKYLNVSSGAGTGGPMMRLGTANEVCILTIK